MIRAIPAMLSMIPPVIRGVTLADLEKIIRITRLTFPAVPRVTTEQLALWMSEQSELLLIDVRSPDEYAVSHLQGAIRCSNSSQIREALARRMPERAVLYCAVGFRSAALTRKIAGAAQCEVFNLEGSIFKWANEGRALFRQERPATQIHAYGPRWAGLLKPGLAAPFHKDSGR